jgi:SAM-dependent methyltransferase
LTPRAERRHALVGPARLWQVKRDFQIAFLRDHGLRPGDRLADIGCGTLRGGIPIIDYLDAGNYHGFEVRAHVLDEGRRELAASGLEHKRPVLAQCDDLGAVAFDERFDVIWGFSVLIHMSDDVLDRALAFVARHLAPAGVFYANVSFEARPDGQWQGFPVVHRPWEFYRDAAARHGLAVEQLGTLSSLGHAPALGDSQMMLRFARAPAA